MRNATNHPALAVTYIYMPGCIFDKQIRRKLSQKAEEFNSKQLNQKKLIDGSRKDSELNSTQYFPSSRSTHPNSNSATYLRDTNLYQN